MDALVSFLTSDSGRIVCYVLLFVGMVDIAVMPVVLGKTIGRIEQTLATVMTAEKRKQAEMQLRSMQLVVRAMKIMGGMFVAFAVFGLTR